jgi:hypothetical protein
VRHLVAGNSNFSSFSIFVSAMHFITISLHLYYCSASGW